MDNKDMRRICADFVRQASDKYRADALAALVRNPDLDPAAKWSLSLVFNNAADYMLAVAYDIEEGEE